MIAGCIYDASCRLEHYLGGSPNQLLLGQIRFSGYFLQRTRCQETGCYIDYPVFLPLKHVIFFDYAFCLLIVSDNVVKYGPWLFLENLTIVNFTSRSPYI
jgi:hypothetical protein